MTEISNPTLRLSEARTAMLQQQARQIQTVFFDHVRRTRGQRLASGAADLARIASADAFLGAEAQRLG